jgi:hypothetical protein
MSNDNKTCATCGSTKISTPEVTHEGMTIFVNRQCECGTTWTDNYTFKNSTDYTPATREKNEELLKDYQKHVDIINAMNHREIGAFMRFAPSGHPYTNCSLPYWDLINARFKELGGWTPALSKSLGW